MLMTSILSLFQTELEYDPELYMRDREGVDCDFDSVNSSSSSDSHSDAPPPQLAFERDRLNGNSANTPYQGLRYEPELPDPPPLLPSDPPYAEAVWRPANRQLQRHPSPPSHVPSYQLADNHSRSRLPTRQVRETPESYQIMESKRQSRGRKPGARGEPRAPPVSRKHGVVDPSAAGPIISSNQHRGHDLQTSPSVISRQGVYASETWTPRS